MSSWKQLFDESEDGRKEKKRVSSGAVNSQKVRRDSPEKISGYGLFVCFDIVGGALITVI